MSLCLIWLPFISHLIFTHSPAISFLPQGLCICFFFFAWNILVIFSPWLTARILPLILRSGQTSFIGRLSLATPKPLPPCHLYPGFSCAFLHRSHPSFVPIPQQNGRFTRRKTLPISLLTFSLRPCPRYCVRHIC